MITRHHRLYWPVVVMILGAAGCGGKSENKPTGNQPGTRGTLGTEYDAKVDAVCGGLRTGGTERPATATMACHSEETAPPTQQTGPGRATPPGTQATQGSLGEPEQILPPPEPAEPPTEQGTQVTPTEPATPPSEQATQVTPPPEPVTPPSEQVTQVTPPAEPATPPSTQSSKGRLGEPEQVTPSQPTQVTPPGQQGSLGTPGRLGRQGREVTPAVPEQTAEQKIANLLVTMHGIEVSESKAIEAKTQNQSVRDFAHMMMVSHQRAIGQNQVLFQKLSIKVDESLANKGIEGGFLQGFSAAGGQGVELDREYMRRQIMEHQRAIELIDALLPQAENPDLHCALDGARREAMAHLEMACLVWSNLSTENSTAGNKKAEPGKVQNRGKAEPPKQIGRQRPGARHQQPTRQGRNAIEVEDDGEL